MRRKIYNKLVYRRDRRRGREPRHTSLCALLHKFTGNAAVSQSAVEPGHLIQLRFKLLPQLQRREDIQQNTFLHLVYTKHDD